MICGLFQLGEQPPVYSKKYSLVLYVPPLDDFTHAALKAMEKFAYDPSRYFVIKKEKSTDCKQPWHTIPRRREIVLDKIDELVTCEVRREEQRHFEQRQLHRLSIQKQKRFAVQLLSL